MPTAEKYLGINQLDRHGGYAAAASWLAGDPDKESLVFRKFDKLAALNLLYMQSEILALEKAVDEFHQSTIESYDMDLKDAARTWETLVQQCTPGTGFRQDAQERMALILELRKKMKDYHEALLLQAEMARLKKPDSRVIDAVKHFFEMPQHLLGGRAKRLFQEKDTNGYEDLVALRAPCETDVLSNFLRRHWHGEDEIARDGISRFKRFNEASIARTVNIVTIAVAAIFLIATIVGFYFVRSPAVKLAMIATFTTAFAISLGLITTARRVEIFAATAAYAAVLVVFVSSSDLSPGQSTA